MTTPPTLWSRRAGTSNVPTGPRPDRRPTSDSWLNLVEVLFGITRQAIRRGSFNSVKELAAAIRGFINGWNDRCHPFTWTKTADQILPHTTRQRTSDARH